MPGTALPGEGESALASSGTGGISRVSNGGDLSGSTSTVGAASTLQSGAGNNPTNPNQTVAGPSTVNPNSPTASGGSGNSALDQLVNMRITGAPVATPATNPSAQLAGQGLQNKYTPTGTGGIGTLNGNGNATTLLSDAKSWIGVPYVYGGTSRSGVDCSGFTQAVYGQIGLNIGRDTTAQFKSGRAVGQDGNWAADVQQLQPGDLIFYGQPGASGPNAHVVMYIGGGQVIQAAHTGTNVSISPLFNSASSDEPFLGVRRYLSEASPAGPAVGGSNTNLNGYVNMLQQQGSNPASGEKLFADAILTGLNDRITPGAEQGLIAWENAEGGNWHNIDSYNPLNTTQPYGGSHGTNGPGVQAYNDWLNGITATLETLGNGRYRNILQALASGQGPHALSQAVASSPWGTGSFA